MQRAWLVVLLALAVAVAGCTQQPSTPDDTGFTGDGGGTTVTGDANATGNFTGNQTSGNATLEGNVSEGNETLEEGEGNETAGNQTSAPPRQVLNETYRYNGAPPAEVTFQVGEGVGTLRVDASASGAIVGLRVLLVDPGGNETTALEGGVVAGAPAVSQTAVDEPAEGTWTLRFEGTGTGEVAVAATTE